VRVKILEEKILEEREAFFKDEIRVVSDEMGARWCANGWAEDLDGAVPTGDRINRGQELVVDPAKLIPAAGE